jgi:hypothetical protein
VSLTEEQEQKLKELAHKNKAEMDDAEITDRVKLALQRKYQRPEWGLFHEVTGKNGRQADAIAYNLYPSRNFKALGFEIKASRSDWKKELKDVSKADWFVGQCKEWYVVAGRKGIVRESELPDGWGLLEMKGGGKLYEVVESDLTEHQNRPLDKEFWARGMQKALKRVRDVKREKNTIERKAYRRGKKDGKEEGDISREQKNKIEKGEKYEKLKDRVNESLYRLDDDKIEKFNKALKVVEKLDADNWRGLMSDLSSLKKNHQGMKENMQEMEDLLKKLDSDITPKSTDKNSLGAFS